MTTQDIIMRLFLITIFSGLIGFEREKNQSHAGLKTHMLVGISATIIALIQQSIMYEVIEYELLFPDISGALRSDPARLIAQVVSGIGFLGGGTIIVTKRNVSGLTTAASIWSIAGIGMGLGMGYYEVSIVGCSFILFTLTLSKYLQSKNFIRRIHIGYIGGLKTVKEIENILEGLGLTQRHLSYSVRMFGNEMIYTSIFEVVGKHSVQFHTITNAMIKSQSIIEVQSTNLE